jgi:nucleoside-diphosphate-sugar epimerase
LRDLRREVAGLDRIDGPFTTKVGSITDRACVAHCMRGVRVVFHAATLHKPHIATHNRRDFVDTNIAGTLNLLEEAVAAGVESFIFTSTTSVFGDALVPPAGKPAAWMTEAVTPIPKNVYGVTKLAAEDLCALFHRNHGLACLVLRTARFFPEDDDDEAMRSAYARDNIKMNEFLSRRVDLSDVVAAHLLAAERASTPGFRRYIISATTPFRPADMPRLRTDAPGAVRAYFPEYEAEYARRDWRMFPGMDRVYVNERARDELGWQPKYSFATLIACLRAGEDLQSPLARLVGSKGYHAGQFAGGRYPVEPASGGDPSASEHS